MNQDSHAASYRSGQSSGEAPFDYSVLKPHLKNLPPRSKTGCWTCRKRKVKCGEERPICAQCVRLGQTCDYEVKYSFKDANKTLVGKKGDLQGNPAWDPSSRKPRLSSPSDCDDTADFTTLSTEEDRERKATFHEPGKFYVVANQDSFSSLPEYNQSSTRRSSGTLGGGSVASGRLSRSTRHSHGESDISPAGDDTVILNRFEMPLDKPAERKNPSPRSTASRTTISPIEQRGRHQLPLPPQLPQYSQSSYTSTSYSSQPSRSSYQPTPLDTSSLQYYNNPPSSSSSTYTPQSQQPSPPYPRAPQFPVQAPSQYPTAYHYAPIVYQETQQVAPFSRLLPQPASYISKSTQPQQQQQQQPQHHQQEPHQQLSTLQPSPLTQQAPFGSSTSYTHHSTPSTYHYSTTSPTTYTQTPSAYSSSAVVAPSYTPTLPGAVSYTLPTPGTAYNQNQIQAQQTNMYAQPYTLPQSMEGLKYSHVPPPQETPSTAYGYAGMQGQNQGHEVQETRQNAQEQGYTRYRDYQGR